MNLKPSGPGALLALQDATTSLISSCVKAFVRRFDLSVDHLLKLGRVNVGRLLKVFFEN